jgi:hypothetical protein
MLEVIKDAIEDRWKKLKEEFPDWKFRFPWMSNQTTYVPYHPEHHKQKVKIGAHTILVSKFEYQGLKLKPYPDMGMYFADSWSRSINLVTSTGVRTHYRWSLYPNIQVAWNDGGVISTELMDDLVTTIQEHLDKKEIIEVGCLGSHGRTGTFLACLLGLTEGLTATQAINTLRQRYCEKAVETDAQINLVHDYLGGSEPLPKPSRGAVVGVGVTGGYSGEYYD